MISLVPVSVPFRVRMINNFRFCAWVSFSVTTRDRGFILGIHLHLGKTNRNQLTVSDVDLYFMAHSI